MKRLITFFLAVALLISLTIPANAAEKDDVELMYVAINDLYALLTIDETTGIASCTGSVSAKSSQPVKVEVRLQRYENGIWVTKKTWTSTGIMYAISSEQYAICSGYLYRVKTTGYVYDTSGNIIESASTYHSVNYPSN